MKTPLDNDTFHGLPMIVESEDNNTYMIEPYVASVAGLKFLWDHVKKHPFLVGDQTRGSYAVFEDYVLSKDTLILLVVQVCTDCAKDEKDTPVGVFYADHIVPGLECRGHYLFWDYQQKGRQKVVLNVVSWMLTEFGMHKIHIEIPRFAYAALRRVRAMGFAFEGINRKSLMYRGKWCDKIRFGVLDEELANGAMESGRIERTDAERGWFGLLDSDEILRHAITKRD